MKRPLLSALVFFLLLLFCVPRANAQLWRDAVEKTFVYRIDNRQAEKLLLGSYGSHNIEDMLNDPEAEYCGEWSGEPDQGHFIHVDIHRNRMNYRYVPIMPFKVFLYKEYGILTLQVVDQQGNIRPDARVRIAGRSKFFNKRVPYDGEGQVYRIDDWSEKRFRILTIELNGFRAVFDLTKHLVSPRYDPHSDNFYSPDFYSYMITDKNKYKPGETVQFKTYALTGHRRPLRKELEVWVRTENWHYKKIGTLPPYNPGGYAGGVHLHDSLGLKLDRSYEVQLREPKGRIVAARSFQYEDYVLYDNKLEVDVAKNVHYYPDENEITIKVTDANGLLALDVSADVVVLRSSVDRSFDHVLTVPDTLMHQVITLDNEVPTVVTVPADIFPNANGTYEVEVKVITYDGQAMSSRDIVSFRREWKQLDVTTRNDTVRFEYSETGKPVKVRAELLYGDGKGRPKAVDLPYEEPFDQGITSYRFRIPEREFSRTIPAHAVDPELYVEGGLEQDSVRLKLVNPLGLEVTWYIYRGNVMMDKGSGKEMKFSAHEPTHDMAWYAEVFYFMGDTEQDYRRTVLPRKENLSIELDMPGRVFPGQTLDATVTVTDNLGYPVRNADLTAFAYNNLLNYHVPDMEYYGPSPGAREQRSSYSLDRKGYQLSSGLDYNYWRAKASLDSLPYYRFIYPKYGMFSCVLNTPDGTTQFAPYVMQDGESVKVHVIEVNDEPVWFSWTGQPQPYSFLVGEGEKCLIRLRISDRAILLDTMQFAPGKKTILSLDVDALPRGVRTVSLGNYLTSREEERYGRLVSSLPVYSSTKGHYLSQGRDSILIYHPAFANAKDGYVLAGPIRPGRSRYGNGVEYNHEGRFHYGYEDNVVYKHDMRVLPQSLYRESTNVITDLGDFALTPPVLAEKVEKFIWRQRFWQPAAIYVAQNGMDLKFRIPERADTTGIATLLFVDRDSNRLVYPDRDGSHTPLFSKLRPGHYDAVLVYNSGRYIRYDSLRFSPGTYTEVEMGAAPLRAADSLSIVWRNAYYFPQTDGGNRFVPADNMRIIYLREPGPSWSTICGFVKDDDGEPLIGATVMLKGTSTGTITDFDGYFELPADPGNNDIVVSYIGFRTHEMTVSAGSLVHIVLQEDANMLSEVVVVGYGVSRSRAVMGAFSTVSSADTMSIPAEELQDDGEPLTPDREAEDKLYRDLIALGGIRSNFSDVGFWQPALVTDRKGQASFSVTFPDNITKWDAVVYAMNRQLKTGTYRQSIRSYKPLMAELRMPGFLVEGDVSMFATNLRNYTTEEDVTGLVTYKLDADTLSSKEVSFSSSLSDRMAFTAPASADSLTASYIFSREDGYIDGEQRTIPVIPRGTEVAEGRLAFLRDNEPVRVSAAEGETVDLIVAGNPLDIYLDAAYYLSGYRYSCNEQLASKLIGLLNIRLYEQITGGKFRYDREVNDIIRRLVGNRNGKLLWSWFGNSPASSYWMSAHIMGALRMAKEQGYQVNMEVEVMAADYMDVRPYRDASINDIRILHALSEYGVEQDYEPAVEHWERWIADDECRQDSLAAAGVRSRSYLGEKLMLWDIRRMQGIGFVADSVASYLRTDILGAVYCDDGISRLWYDDALTTTIAAYKMVRADFSLMHYKEAMQAYVLGSKRNGWNTYYSALAVGTIFPDLVAAVGETGTVQASVKVEGREEGMIEKLPYQVRLLPGEELTVTKTGGLPLVWSAYSYRSVTEERIGDAFEISTEILGADTLETGKPVTLRVEVEVKQKGAEYVMIEVPIPAGCDYASKHQNYYGYEVHREHFKEKTVIFCASLPEGRHSYRIELLPRFSGRYTLNPAKVELMYFPVVSSNNSIGEVVLQ